jgi:uncharacterized NAD(P)/FAD-binding protein YdhS
VLTHPPGSAQVIAVIGGGASGTLTAIQLLRTAAATRLRLHVVLIDSHGRHGRGQAYSTEIRAHLLNAMAGQMSAFADDPDHLVRWAAGRTGGGADSGRGADSGGAVTSTTFLPREDYGQYLRDTLADAEQQALPVARLTCLRSSVLDIQRSAAGRPLRLILTSGQLEAEVAVLATGNVAGRLPFQTPPSDHILFDPWEPGALPRVTGGDGDTVVIVGTGLTMVDLAVAIAASKPDARIHAVSRHGLLPRTHPGAIAARNRPLWLPVLTRTTGPVRLADLMWQVRSTIDSGPAGWYEFISALRPFVGGLWRRMPDEDKRMFLRHVARYWEVHRHLMPPATASRITSLRATGQLSVHRGSVIAVTGTSQLKVLVDGGEDVLQLEADWLINGTGAASDIGTAAGPLLRNLFMTGLARPDALRLGIAANPCGAVLDRRGGASEVLFTLGPPLRGLWYETTAIPEIRDQAAALAQQIISDRRLSQRPGSAA